VAALIVSSVLSGVQDEEIQAAYTTARLWLRVHHPDQTDHRFGGFGPRVCRHHAVAERWDGTPHGCSARLHHLKIILTVTRDRPPVRRALVAQGLISQAEADEGIQEKPRKRGGHRRRARQSRPSQGRRSAQVPVKAVGVARVVSL
jgi:hypothetical protein